jgi:hypothetical protein
MAFTSQLGTSNAYLGNIVLGSGGGTGGSSQNDSLTLACTAAVTITPNLRLPLTISVDGVSATTILDGTGYFKTLTVDGIAAFTVINGQAFATSITIDGVAAISETGIEGIVLSLSVSGVSALAVSGVTFNGLLLTIAGQSSITVAALTMIFKAITISGSATCDSPGGVVYSKSLPIEGFAALTVLPGTGFPQTLSIDGIAAFSEVEQYIKEFALNIDGVSDITLSVQYTANIHQTIAGFSAVSIVTTANWLASVSVGAIAVTFVENIYDVLYVTTTTAGISIAYELIQAPAANPHGVAGIGISSQVSFARHITQTLALTHLASRSLGTAIVGQPFNLTQHATVKKVHRETVTSTLSMAQEAEMWRPTNNSLVLTQTATVKRVRFVSVTQTLRLSDSVKRNTVINRSVAHTLVFNPPNIKRIQGRFTVELPSAYPVLVSKRCLVVLGVPAQTVILPCPKFDDTQAFQGTLDLKRSMIGGTYTVVKNTAVQRLKYDFDLWTNKYLELRVFLLAHSSETMNLVNWKGENWVVTLVNNPIQLTAEERFQPRGERYSVTLEFDGVRIGGQS